MIFPLSYLNYLEKMAVMKNRNLLDSFNNAINGIIHAIKYERNMKIHAVSAILVLMMSLLYRLTRLEFLAICLTICLVIICELLNTAIEVLVDIIVDVYHPKAKIIKDVTAGAVLVTSTLALIVGYVIFFDKVKSSLENGIIVVRQSPMHLTVIALIITMLTVLILKARLKTGTPFHGGMPSGHAAASFSITTAIALWTDNMSVTILSLFIAFLVIQSRLEGKIHNMPELVAGAALGILVTLLLFQVFYK